VKKFLEIAGISISLPLDSPEGGSLFFTNAILCHKEGSDKACVYPDWYRNCGPRYLKPLIDIVSPKVVICMGKWAYETVMRCYDLEPKPLQVAVDAGVPVILSDGIKLFVVYHCSPTARMTRKDEQQENDWAQIGKWLKRNKVLG
jgi:uracil-DNA glycosylase